MLLCGQSEAWEAPSQAFAPGAPAHSASSSNARYQVLRYLRHTNRSMARWKPALGAKLCLAAAAAAVAVLAAASPAVGLGLIERTWGARLLLQEPETLPAFPPPGARRCRQPGCRRCTCE